MENFLIDNNIDREELKRDNVFISTNVVICGSITVARGVSIKNSTIHDGCIIGTNSVIENCDIGNNSIVKSSFIEDSSVGSNCTIGPFAHIRDKTKLGDNCRVGNFVEIKNSTIANDCKMAHLAYIGDADVGENCNIGCGVVFCNFNGEIKSRCKLGKNVFVGSNSNLIAPIEIGDNAYIAGGSTINQEVGQNELAIARARQTNKQDFDNPYLNRINKRK